MINLRQARRRATTIFLFVIAACVSCELTCSNVAHAAEIPSKYRGVWGYSTCDLPKSEDEGGEDPFFVVSAKETKGHEESCTVASVQRAIKGDTLSFKCSGEGEEWSRKEVWSLQQRTISGVSEINLVRRGSDGESIYRKCALKSGGAERLRFATRAIAINLDRRAISWEDIKQD